MTQKRHCVDDGALCLFAGENSITTGAHPDDCTWAWTMVLGTHLLLGVLSSTAPSSLRFAGYIAANIAYNIVILLVIKYGSAALLYVVWMSFVALFQGYLSFLSFVFTDLLESLQASAVVLPLANIAFTLDFIMGNQAQNLSVYDIVGLVVILIGLLIYRSTSEEAPPTATTSETVCPLLHLGDKWRVCATGWLTACALRKSRGRSRTYLWVASCPDRLRPSRELSWSGLSICHAHSTKFGAFFCKSCFGLPRSFAFFQFLL